MHILWFSATLVCRCPCAKDYKDLLGTAWEVLFSSCIEIKNDIYMQVHTWVCITFIWTAHCNTLFHDWSKLHTLKFNQKTVCCTKGLLSLQLGVLRGSRPLWWSIDIKARVCLWHMHTLFELGWTLRDCGTRGRGGKPLQLQPCWNTVK